MVPQWTTKTLTKMSDEIDRTIYDACENIDSSLFSGDAFYNKVNREHLLKMMERWKRNLGDENFPPPEEETS